MPKIRITKFKQMKEKGEKISMITAYDSATAEIVDSAGIDSVLVGDSLGNVISVASLDRKKDGLASFSNYGSETVDFATHGTRISIPDPYDGKVDGTSYSAAIVSRIMAIAQTKNPEVSVVEIVECIRKWVELSTIEVSTSGILRLDIEDLTCPDIYDAPRGPGVDDVVTN